jgi:membrane-associated phospholipid phosphatase
MRRHGLAAWALVISATLFWNSYGAAQTTDSQTASSSLPNAPSAGSAANTDDLPLQLQPHSPATVARTPKHALTDLTRIAVSPIFLRPRDLEWMLPLTGATIAAFSTDTRTMRDVVSRDPSFNQTSGNVSDGLRDGFIAVPVVLFGAGSYSHNEHVRETGILAGEAVFDAFITDEFTKLVSFRERPNVDNSKGNFYIGNSGGINSSFVSGHSMIAWSSAAVMADESHSRWKQFLIYTAATGVSVSRVTAQQHFPTDVLLGSAGGWLIGHFVYRAHHHADVLPSR